MHYKTRARIVLFAATGVQFISGILYIWSIVGKALITDYHWSATQASLPYTVATIVFATSMFFAGLIQDKKGPRLMATIGSALLGIGLFVSSYARTPIAMVLLFSVVVGVGIGINNVSATPAAVKWFPARKKGMITGIVVAGIALASVMYSPLTHYLIESFGLPKAFTILGIGAFILAVALAQFIVNPPPDAMPEINAEAARSAKEMPATVEKDWRQVLRTGDFYKLWVMFAFSSSAGLMIIGHIANIAEVQADWAGGYLLAALIAVFNALGRIGGGAISDRIGRVNLLRIAFLAQAVNMALFSFFKSAPALAVGVMVAGVCYGAVFSVFPAATADLFGFKNFGANYGLVFLAWGLGGVIGPLLAGNIFDATMSYHNAYLVAFALLIVAAAISLTLKLGKKPPADK